MMSSDFLQQLIQDATANGDEAAPSHLLALLATKQNPIASLQDRDEENDLFEAFYRDFPFIRTIRTDPGLDSSNMSGCVPMFRWLLSTLREWKPDADPRRELLTAILVAIHATDQNGMLWYALPDDVLENTSLSTLFHQIVRAWGITFTAKGNDPAPIWEQEAVEYLLARQVARDWANMGDAWKPFQGAIYPSTIHIQAANYLYRRGVAKLAVAGANYDQIAAAMLLAQTLHDEQRLQLALESNNPFIEFACTYITLTASRNTSDLPPMEQQILSDVLAKVVKDNSQWRGWMAAFNKYPVRYPALQTSLGKALASAPEPALSAYVDSIDLFPRPIAVEQGRRNVATCLNSFQTTASSEQRQRLWKHAHERWLSWNFGGAENYIDVFQVCGTELDYAVVGYFIECLDDGERDNAIGLITMQLRTIENAWYKSSSDIKSTWFRLLSRLQPCAHACQAPTDFLQQVQTYLPSEFASNEYTKLRYGNT